MENFVILLDPRVYFASFYFILYYWFSIMADFNAVSKAFVEFYYQTFDANRANLAPLYASIINNLVDGQSGTNMLARLLNL